jgi:hypothetical protein
VGEPCRIATEAHDPHGDHGPLLGAVGAPVTTRTQAENELPQPQPPVEFGFVKVKPDPCMEVT